MYLCALFSEPFPGVDFTAQIYDLHKLCSLSCDEVVLKSKNLNMKLPKLKSTNASHKEKMYRECL